MPGITKGGRRWKSKRLLRDKTKKDCLKRENGSLDRLRESRRRKISSRGEQKTINNNWKSCPVLERRAKGGSGTQTVTATKNEKVKRKRHRLHSAKDQRSPQSGRALGKSKSDVVFSQPKSKNYPRSLHKKVGRRGGKKVKEKNKKEKGGGKKALSKTWSGQGNCRLG